jgi:hypothetical protein
MPSEPTTVPGVSFREICLAIAMESIYQIQGGNHDGMWSRRELGRTCAEIIARLEASLPL